MIQVVGSATAIDLTGLRCPYLARRVRKALSRARAGELLEFVCSDPLASVDIPHLVATLGDQLVAQTSGDGKHGFAVRRTDRPSTR